MKQGDLVWVKKQAVLFPYNDGDKWGVILEKMDHDSLNRKFFGMNDMFSVLWNDGTVGNNVWDYDLDLMDNEKPLAKRHEEKPYEDCDDPDCWCFAIKQEQQA
jgi:hypothetical protein